MGPAKGAHSWCRADLLASLGARLRVRAPRLTGPHKGRPRSSQGERGRSAMPTRKPLGRNTAAYKRYAREFCLPRPGARCWLCRELIVFGLRPRHSLGPSLDHVLPLSKGGALLDPNNARLAHYGCNADRGNALVTQAGGMSNASRQW